MQKVYVVRHNGLLDCTFDPHWAIEIYNFWLRVGGQPDALESYDLPRATRLLDLYFLVARHDRLGQVRAQIWKDYTTAWTRYAELYFEHPDGVEILPVHGDRVDRNSVLDLH